MAPLHGYGIARWIEQVSGSLVSVKWARSSLRGKRVSGSRPLPPSPGCLRAARNRCETHTSMPGAGVGTVCGPKTTFGLA